MSESIRDPRIYVQEWIALNGIQITHNNVTDCRGRDLPAILDSQYLDYVAAVKAFNATLEKKEKQVPRERDTLLAIAFNEYTEAVREANFDKLIQTIAFTGENEVLTEFVMAVTKNKETLELDLAFTKHFIWQIKRKMNRKPVKNHLMPIIVGKSGSGKSMAVNALLSPIKDYVLYMDVTSFIDNKNGLTLSQNYVVFCDEMTNSLKADRNALKNKITSDTNTTRKLCTNINIQAKNRTTLIGCSNDSVDLILNDPTSMRRFGEIVSADLCDWDKINSTDYLRVYQGIDENNDEGYLKDVMQSVIQHQEKLKSVEDVEQFLRDFDLIPEVGGETEHKLVSLIYEDYQQWCIKNGVRNVQTKVVVCKKLTRLLGESDQVKVNRANNRYYNVKKQETLEQISTLVPSTSKFYVEDANA